MRTSMRLVVMLSLCSRDVVRDVALTGIEELTKLVRKFLDEPSSYKPEEMRACLDSWREVLFNHLNQEVSCVFCES